ncbi:glycosyltransferase family 2 protein [Thermodesulfobacteriota bacterium]
MPAVSVIIPCYNQGAFLREAVESVRSQTFEDLEIIIVDDGSDDEQTDRICAAQEGLGIRVIRTANQGLASARNNGIAESKGQYILPLDADDKIAPEYLSEAVEILDSDNQIGIVYCQARLFGAVEGDWHLPDYSLDEMLKDNIIFCTALFRKSDWQISGGYDPAMVHGWEDYDFWLSLIGRGLKVHRLEGKYFFYRVSPDSMVRSKEKAQKIEMFKRIFQRQQKLFSDHIEVWLEPLLDLREQYLTSRLYVDCGSGMIDSSSVMRKIEVGKRAISFAIDSYQDKRALRFDPVDRPACLKIDAIELVIDGQRTFLDFDKADSNARHRERNYFLFSTDDPQIFLTIDPEIVEQLTEVIITCDLKSIDMAALQEIVEFQKAQLERGKKTISLPKWLKSRS